MKDVKSSVADMSAPWVEKRQRPPQRAQVRRGWCEANACQSCFVFEQRDHRDPQRSAAVDFALEIDVDLTAGAVARELKPALKCRVRERSSGRGEAVRGCCGGPADGGDDDPEVR